MYQNWSLTESKKQKVEQSTLGNHTLLTEITFQQWAKMAVQWILCDTIDFSHRIKPAKSMLSVYRVGFFLASLI